MKTQLLIAALAIAALAAGCKKSTPADESSPASGTSSGSMSVTQSLQNAKEAFTNAWQKTKAATTNALENAKEVAQSAVDYTYDKKDAFAAKASADLESLDQNIKELSDKAANASDNIKADAQVKLQELREKREALGKKMDDVKNATEANWNDAKAAFVQSYDDVKASFKAAWQWLTDKMGS